jgi:hypothetical protein
MKDTPSKLDDTLASKGRRGDTIVAHISQREAAILKMLGGASTINPKTGMLEFYGGDGDSDNGGSDPGGVGGGSDAGTGQGGDTGTEGGPNSGVNDSGIQGDIGGIPSNDNVAEGFSTVMGAKIGDPTAGLGEQAAYSQQGLAINESLSNRDPGSLSAIYDNFVDEMSIQMNTPTSALSMFGNFAARAARSKIGGFVGGAIGSAFGPIGSVVGGLAGAITAGRMSGFSMPDESQMAALNTTTGIEGGNIEADQGGGIPSSTSSPNPTVSLATIPPRTIIGPSRNRTNQYESLTGLRG